MSEVDVSVNCSLIVYCLWFQLQDHLASLDINGNDFDPTPTDDGQNKHGTRCAGVVAAVGGRIFGG